MKFGRISKQTFIKSISDKHYEILIKIGKEFDIKSTPKIFWFLLERFYSNKSLIESQRKQIEQLENKLYQSNDELNSIKSNLNGIFKFIDK